MFLGGRSRKYPHLLIYANEDYGHSVLRIIYETNGMARETSLLENRRVSLISHIELKESTPTGMLRESVKQLGLIPGRDIKNLLNELLAHNDFAIREDAQWVIGKIEQSLSSPVHSKKGKKGTGLKIMVSEDAIMFIHIVLYFLVAKCKLAAYSIQLSPK